MKTTSLLALLSSVLWFSWSLTPVVAAETVAATTAPATVAPLREGEQFKVINPVGKTAQPEVVEFFSYTCPHCRAMEGFLTDWKKAKPGNVAFRRMHVVGMFGAQGDLLARAFYTAEVLGITDKVHQPLFDRVHLERNPPRDEQAVASFFAQYGVKETAVLSTMHAFPVNSKMEQAEALLQKYRLRSVPSFVVNDKYLTDGGMAKGADMLSRILNELPLR